MKVFLTVLSLLILTSCYKHNEEEFYAEADCDTSNVSFSEDIMPIIATSCAVVGCHVQGGDGDGIYENYNQIKEKVDEGSLKRRVVVRRDMPPSGGLTNCQVAFIEQWLAEGAPNN